MSKGSRRWSVYILRCSDGKFYTGVTTDLARRFREHNRGRGCKFTAYRRPVALVFSEPQPDRSSAQKREARIKRWPRPRKESLIRESGSAFLVFGNISRPVTT
jgi:putative endonuclease